MKTINCTLPIYDRIGKQSSERVKRSNLDILAPVVCPQYRLPSFQWNAEAEAAPVKIEIMDSVNTSYSDIATPPENDTTSILADPYDTFTVAGNAITSAVDSLAGTESCNIFLGIDVVAGDVLAVEFTLTLNSGQLPTLILYDEDDDYPGWERIDAVEGLNKIYLYCAKAGSGVRITIYNTDAADWETDDIIVKMGDITGHFVTLPSATVLTDTYYSYSGETLNYLLKPGDHYLKITNSDGYVYYSDWFRVECIYKNLITAWTNTGYNLFTAYGTAFVAQENDADGFANSNTFTLANGESVTVIFYLANYTGQLSTVGLFNDASVDSETAELGLNVFTFTAEEGGEYYIYFENTAFATMQVHNVLALREYSDKYIRFDFSNTCDLGDVVYSDGFSQTLWLETEAIEPSFPLEEQGQNNGLGKFIRTFARQVKTYLARTKTVPDFIVQVLHRMKLHDTVTLIDTVGNDNSVYNLNVEHEWLYEDKYSAKSDLTFDYNEAFVVSPCCVNLT